jgi:predicted DNA-binding transcriptional regulator AlpA
MSPELLKKHITANEQRAYQRAQFEYLSRVLTFRQWCDLNGFSRATGYRLIGAGRGPVITQLSDRRIGITIGNNAAWQASRAR